MRVLLFLMAALTWSLAPAVAQKDGQGPSMNVELRIPTMCASGALEESHTVSPHCPSGPGSTTTTWSVTCNPLCYPSYQSLTMGTAGQCYQGISILPTLPPKWYHCDYIPPYPLVYFGNGFRVKGYNGFVLVDQIGDILCAVAPAYAQSYCDCDDVWTCLEDPVVISLKDSQYELTDTKGGVEFDLNGDGETEQIPWTAGKDDAFLVLDRNGNGLIDDGRELFSHVSPQQPSGTPNGFHALRMFDDPLNGGNEDGRINASDEIYGSLRLWLDTDHDGSTDAGELVLLASVGLTEIELDYTDDHAHDDEHRNTFRYSAPAHFVDG